MRLGFSAVGSPSTKWGEKILDFGPPVHNFGWLELLWSDGALVTSLYHKSLNSRCFLPLEKWIAKIVVHSYKEYYYSNSDELYANFTPSIMSKITIRIPSYCTLTSHFPKWKCLFTSRNRFWKCACAKQCILPNRNSRMKYHYKTYSWVNDLSSYHISCPSSGAI